MQIFVCIKRSAVDLADADGNVGAVVGNSFKVCEEILENITQFHSASSFLQPFDVFLFHSHIERINDFFHWFDLMSQIQIILAERIKRQMNRFRQSCSHCL